MLQRDIQMHWQAQAQAARSDRRIDVITFITLGTSLIALIGHLMKVGLW